MIKKILNILILTALTIQINAQDLTDKEKRSVLNAVVQNLEKTYPFPEVIERTIIGLRTQISEGFYDKYNTPNSFATHVTNSLEEFSNDKHLDLIYNPQLAIALLEDETSNDYSYTEDEAKIEVWNNYGFKELSILDGNIGYLNLSVFFATEYAGKTADISMNYFSNCNALIIDLRQNGGGWGDMVDFLLSYFVDNTEPLLINISQSTLDSSYYSSVIPAYVSGQKLTNIPIYILTSAVTASAAEGFTSNIKFFNKNVTVVGKKTSGAENPVEHLAINEDFVLQIPSWKRIFSSNPNVWEGVGIDPDIEVEVEDAKRIAHIKALEKLIGSTRDSTALDKYQWALDGLKANYNNVDIINLEKYAGNYGKIKITNQGSKLFCQYKERSAKLLIPISEDYFIVEGIDYYRIKFYSVKNKEMLKQIFSYGTIREMFKIE